MRTGAWQAHRHFKRVSGLPTSRVEANPSPSPPHRNFRRSPQCEGLAVGCPGRRAQPSRMASSSASSGTGHTDNGQPRERPQHHHVHRRRRPGTPGQPGRVEDVRGPRPLAQQRRNFPGRGHLPATLRHVRRRVSASPGTARAAVPTRARSITAADTSFMCGLRATTAAPLAAR